MAQLKIIVTCGPAYEPIDQARRITNFSTGRLGVVLANALTEAGHQVFCFKGEGSTYGESCRTRLVQTFTTNEDLSARIESLSRTERVDAIFHAAALCDYRVERVLNEHDEAVASPKLSSRSGRLKVLLVPAIKVLPQLRGWFPQCRIVGWKYELAGSREEALAKAWRQIQEEDTEACVLNGAAYGTGFAFCVKPARIESCQDLPALVKTLVNWLPYH